MSNCRRILFLLVCLLLMPQRQTKADEVKLRCIADTNVSSYESEQEFNYGGSTRLRLKGIQMLALLRFDTAPVRNWNIQKATLFLRYAGADRKLRTLGFSTISAPWEEGTGAGEKKPGEVCFAWRNQGKTRWAGPNTDFTDVSFTAGHTLAAYADLKDAGDGWFAVPVEPRLVQAMIAEVSYGLAVTDEKGQTAANNDVYSREQSNSAPYLVVEGQPSPRLLPSPVQNLKAAPDTMGVDFEHGAVRLSFTSPPGAFAYEISYRLPGRADPMNVPRYAIPFASPGKMQFMQITGLPPNTPLQEIQVIPIGLNGNSGAPTALNGVSSPARFRPAPLKAALATAQAAQEPPVLQGSLRAWAYPDTEKAHPVSGNLLEEVGLKGYAGAPSGNYRRGNAVWDGRTIRLNAARNEFVGFHLLLEAAKGALKSVQIQMPEQFVSTAGQNSANWKPAFTLFRDWYVRDGEWFPEVCLPLQKTFDIPSADNGVPGQRNQSVFAELLTPRDTPPGVYRANCTVSAEGVAPFSIPIEITVNGLTLPDTLGFDISLNTYGTVGGPFGLDDRTPEYRALEIEYHRMAHRHRATLVPLGYSHSGTITSNYAPPVQGEGAAAHVTDWTAWDRQFGPYLDGSAFADMPRKGVPVTHLYLPFHEAWPADIRQHYHYEQTVQEYPALIAEHAMKAPPIEQAMDKELGEAFTAVVRQFAQHFKEKGWNRTQFQFYQNDKYYYKDPKQGGRGTSWWLLDEPNHRDDWLALAYFARLFRAGMKDFPDVPMVHREDISRPQWQRDYLDGLVDVMVVSGEIYEKGPRLREMQSEFPVRFWNYGSANPVHDSNLTEEGWAVRAWLAGADAIVPWQSVGGDENYTRAEETALLLPGKRFGIGGPIASLRLKALRRAQQDAEYLILLSKAKGWDRDQTAAAIAGLVKLKATFNQNDADDAGRYRFGALRADDFSALRRAAAEAAAKP